jgi:predicted transposase/invertase (TIGR01784 family)
VFIELPKFKAKNYPEKKLQVLWLRFMAELNDQARQVPPEWLEVPEIKQAVELADYDRYWDAISIEKTLVGDALAEGIEKGIAMGEKKIKAALAGKSLIKDLSVEEVATLTDLSLKAGLKRR